MLPWQQLLEESNTNISYTRFPQATTKLQPPYLGTLPGLRKPIFRQHLLTVEAAFVVVENIKRV